MDIKKSFYLTFCGRHQHKNGYCRILASSYESATLLAIAKFAMDWQQIYKEDDFNKAKYRSGEVIFIEGS